MPSAGPSYIKCKDHTKTTLKIEYGEIPEANRNGEILGYGMELSKLNETGGQYWKATYIMYCPFNRATVLKDLVPYGHYEVYL